LVSKASRSFVRPIRRPAEAPKKHDWLDYLGSITTFLSGVVLGLAGLIATSWYNQVRLTLEKQKDDSEITIKKMDEFGKYAHYLISTKESERTVGLTLISLLGYREDALEIIRITKDQAGYEIAKEQVNSPDSKIRAAAQSALAVLNTSQRESIEDQLKRREGTTYDGAFSDPGGQLVFGIGAWTFQSGLDKLLNKYLADANAKFSDDIKPYLDRINAHDNKLADDDQFKSLLKQIGGDGAMHKLEDNWFNLELNQVIVESGNYGLRLPLSIDIIYDTFKLEPGHIKIYADDATKELGGSPITGVSETEWVKKYLEARLDWHQQHKSRQGIINRMEGLLQAVSKGDWQLTDTAPVAQSNH
jgi:hypothetical protein